MKANIITNYIKESIAELNKVTWPTKNQAVKMTMTILAFCLVFALVVGVLDFAFNEGYTYLLKSSF